MFSKSALERLSQRVALELGASLTYPHLLKNFLDKFDGKESD